MERHPKRQVRGASRDYRHHDSVHQRVEVSISIGGVADRMIAAAFRELYEETGITPDAVEILYEVKGWVHYDWPRRRQNEKHAMGATNWRGQRQVPGICRFRRVCTGNIALVHSSRSGNEICSRTPAVPLVSRDLAVWQLSDNAWCPCVP